MKIYCAGPLFNNKEKEEMAEIATVLEESGYQVFLPHRDGFEFARLSEVLKTLGLSNTQSKNLLNKAIFTLDVYEVLNSNGLVLNINGRVPDEGAMVEAGIAWSAGKQIVIYKNDSRTLIDGTDNPLLMGLSGFIAVSDMGSIPNAFQRLLAINKPSDKEVVDNSRLRDLYEKGQVVSRLAQKIDDKTKICRELVRILGED